MTTEAHTHTPWHIITAHGCVCIFRLLQLHCVSGKLYNGQRAEGARVGEGNPDQNRWKAADTNAASKKKDSVLEIFLSMQSI